MDSTRTQNVISFCSGYLGLEHGLRRAGVDVRTVCYLEIEAYVQALLVKEIEEGRLDPAPIWSDLKTFDASRFRGKVDGVTCGYPCQPFSNSGKREGEKDPRHLWTPIRKHINTIGARWVFAENVYGHISLGLSTVISDLEEDGFKTAWGIFSAEEVGAPHQRKRVFILAHRGGIGSETGLPEPISWKERDPEEPINCCAGEELGDAAGVGSCRGGEDCSRVQSKVSGQGPKSNELGNPSGDGWGKGSPSKEKERTERKGEKRRMQKSPGGCDQLQFPARPNEIQYEWEPPRTTESGLGGNSDGTDHRVDRLRLLGNGVCIPTAELAYATLWKELNDGK